MSRIVIYTTRMCPFCTAAKALLAKKGASYEEIDVSFDPQGRHAMSERAGGRRTVPQIFVGDTHVGGCEELYALERAGSLDPLLAGG
jgi:glutaredoxin 3